MIFAFLLFMGAVGVALLFMNPVRDSGQKELINEHALNGIVRYSDVGLISNSVVLPAGDNIEDTFVNIGWVNTSYRASASDSFGNLLPVIRSGDIVGVSPKDRFFIIRLSDGIEENYSDYLLGGADSGGYTISSNSFEEVLSEKKIIGLKKVYEEDYGLAKSLVGVSPNMDFSFYLDLDSDGLIEAGTDKNKGSEVFVIEKNIKVIERSGKIKFGVLAVSIW